MPFIQVTMIEGRTTEQKHALMAALTQAAVDSIGAKPESVRVALYEVSGDDWSTAGVPMSVTRAAQTAAQTSAKDES
jgi:4-oxalocrotonate tautomerase